MLSSVFCIVQYTIAMMGYAEECETTVLELTYNYGVTEYTKGNSYAQVRIVFLQRFFRFSFLLSSSPPIHSSSYYCGECDINSRLP